MLWVDQRVNILPMNKLPDATVEKIDQLFHESARDDVKMLLLTQCSENLPLTSSVRDHYVRIHFAVLKLSDGKIDKLIEAITLAQTDWRDLLVAAGFGYDTKAHLDWEVE